jgi:antitoxin ParD1/3/4
MALTPEPLKTALKDDADRLSKAWMEGLTSGPPAPFDIDDIKRKARARFGSNPCPKQRP